MKTYTIITHRTLSGKLDDKFYVSGRSARVMGALDAHRKYYPRCPIVAVSVITQAEYDAAYAAYVQQQLIGTGGAQ